MTVPGPEAFAAVPQRQPRRPVITVTANPAVDLTYRVPKLVPGASHRVSTPLLRAGGKGLNVARVVHQTGHRTIALATVGGATGSDFSAELASSGLPHALTEVAPPTRRSMAFVDDEAGQTSIFNEPGHRLTDAEWVALDHLIDRHLTGAGVVVGSGSLPEGAPVGFYPSLIRRAREHGLPCIIDTSGAALLAAADAGATVLKPNHHELLEATGAPTIDSGARELLHRGARIVVVSCAEDGMLLYRADEPTLRGSLPRLQGNPTGAGDAAVAALAVALADGRATGETLLRLAVAWSASAVLMPAAGELDPGYPTLEAAVTLSNPPTIHPPHQETGP